MLRPRHTLTWVILTTAVWALMAGAFANTAAADGANSQEAFSADDTVEGDEDETPATVNCVWEGKIIDCTGPDGTWWDGNCYVGVFSDGKGDPDDFVNLVEQDWWDYYGKEPGSGVLVRCEYFGNGDSICDDWACQTHPFDPYWVETDTKPSLKDLTDEVHLLVKGIITAPQIGIFPGDLLENNPEAMGLVGVPTWFWSNEPGPGIGSTWTKTDTVLGHTLTVTAELDKTVWDTGDGEEVVCGLGTKAYNVHRPKLSPSRCDHVYMERGTYTVTATSHVSVTWSGAGHSGSFTVSVQRSGSYHVGENQVLIVSGPTVIVNE
jgi:hypothetical protein